MSRLPLILLLPVVLAQGARLRRVTPRLPAATPREGGSGAMRLLVTRAAQRLAAERGIPVVRGLEGAHVAADRFHPDAVGYAGLAADVAAALHLD